MSKNINKSNVNRYDILLCIDFLGTSSHYTVPNILVWHKEINYDTQVVHFNINISNKLFSRQFSLKGCCDLFRYHCIRTLTRHL